MNYLQQYRIPFTGLKLDRHVFDFEIDKRFFDEFEYSIVKDGNLKAIVTLDKQETMMIATFDIEGYIQLECDVCLSSFPWKTKVDERLIIKFFGSEDLEDETEEILVLSAKEFELDIAPLIYEYINLAAPFHNRCEEPGNTPSCDQEMLDKINQLSADNKEEQQTENIDPRWEALNKIKKQ